MTLPTHGVADETARYHHGDLANACIEAAAALLREKGIAGVTLRDVARQIGVSRSAPYRHFADKRALLAACATVGYRRLTEAVETELAHHESCDFDTVRSLMRCYAYFGADDPHLYRLMFGYDFALDEYPELTAQAAAAFQVLHDTVEQGQAQGLLAPGETYAQVLLLWSTAHGLVSLCNDLAPSLVFDPRALAHHLDSVFAIIGTALNPIR